MATASLKNAPAYRVSLFTVICLVMANMIGTGIFSSLGFQLIDIQSGFSILMLWVVGGVFAICGALSYAELSAALPRSGGEFHFISRIYHPGWGFLAGWISVVAGFAAPIALGAMLFGQYAGQVLPGIPPRWLSIGLVLVLSAAQMGGLIWTSRLFDAFALLKIFLVLVLIGIGVAYTPAQSISFAPHPADLGILVSKPFAVSLTYVMYAYSGWNAAIYIIDEVRDAPRNLPRALFVGTFLVMIIYVLINWVFLRTTPVAALKGQLVVAYVVAGQIYGPAGAKWIAGLIALTLISFVNAMVWTGPSVLKVMGEDYPRLSFLARRSANHLPSCAMWIQFVLVMILLLTARYDNVIEATQFVLTLCSLVTALGVIVLRWKRPDLPRPYRVWAYPWTPLLFAMISLFMLYNLARDKPWESLGGLAFLGVGWLGYLWFQRTPKSSLATT